MAILCLAIALGAAILAIGQLYLWQAQVQSAADTAAAQFRQSGSRDSASAIARVNGADVVSIDIDAPSEISVSRTIDIPILRRSATLTARSPLYPHSTGSIVTIPPGGDYRGELTVVDGVLLCPAVASSFLAMRNAASTAGVRLHPVSGYRGHAEQAELYRRLGPRLAAPPGQSLHHQATELDIDVATQSSTYAWLQAHAPSFGFIQRYSWEPWHWGNVRGC